MSKELKVLLFNGSPHKEGCTYTALKEIADTLEAEGIKTFIYQVGNEAIASCKACGACSKLGKCVIDDKVNEFGKMCEEADGFIFGSPVYYAAANGALVAFMDRLFYSDKCAKKNSFALKPAAAIASARATT